MLELEDSYYKLIICEGDEKSFTQYRKNNVLFEIENEYKSFFMNDIIEGIIRVVSNHIIELIKSDV
jgi:hypothetical protein